MRAATVTGVLLLCLAGALHAQRSAAMARRNGLILETAGQAGGFTVGTPISGYENLVTPIAGTPGVYTSTNGLYRIVVDERGVIQSVTTDRSSVLTTQLIRPGISTLQNVLARYGQPRRIEHDSGRIKLVYDGTVFSVPWAGSRPPTGPELNQLLSTPVSTVTVTRATP